MILSVQGKIYVNFQKGRNCNMVIKKVTSIKFVKHHKDKNSVFEVSNSVEISFVCGEDRITHKNIPIHTTLHNWREVFASDTQIIVTCEIETDNKKVITGGFDLDELLKGKLVKIE